MKQKLKGEEDDMLIVHQNPPTEETSERTSSDLLPRLEGLRETAFPGFLAAVESLNDRSFVIEFIQNKFGNKVAEKVIRQSQKPMDGEES